VWRESKTALTTNVDGVSAIPANLAATLDALYDELEGAGGGLRFDWERRLVTVAIDLRACLTSFPGGWWNRLAFARVQATEPASIDARTFTPADPTEMQSRVLARMSPSGIPEAPDLPRPH
jgi:hypothetical protein